MVGFRLISDLVKKDFIIDLPLSRVLMNDVREFPWIFLVPRENNIVQINQLSHENQQQLMCEINLASNIMEKLFTCDRLNISAIGNMTPQLHIHIICRRKDDPYWPDVCWNKPMSLLLVEERKVLVSKIRTEFKINSANYAVSLSNSR